LGGGGIVAIDGWSMQFFNIRRGEPPFLGHRERENVGGGTQIKTKQEMGKTRPVWWWKKRSKSGRPEKGLRCSRAIIGESGTVNFVVAFF